MVALTVTIRPLASSDAEACDAIMRGLPDFFGHERGLADCAQAVRSQDGWAADADGRVVGVATWCPRTRETAEVTWMAVQRDRRQDDIGTALIETLSADPQVGGFLPLIELDIWETDIALLQVRSLMH